MEFLQIGEMVGRLTGHHMNMAGKVDALETLAENLHAGIFDGKGPYSEKVNTDNRPGLRQIQIDMNGDGDVDDLEDLRVIEQNPEKTRPDGELTSTAERAANGEEILQVYAGQRRWPCGVIVDGKWAKVPMLVRDVLGV